MQQSIAPRKVGPLTRSCRAIVPNTRSLTPTTRAWAIIRRGQRTDQRTSDRQLRGERRQADRASRTGRSRAQGQEREVTAGAR